MSKKRHLAKLGIKTKGFGDKSRCRTRLKRCLGRKRNSLSIPER